MSRRPQTTIVGPEDDWQRLLHGLAPGDELALGPGRYVGGLAITRGGDAGLPIVIRALDASRPPIFMPSVAHKYVLDVRADDVVVRGLCLAPTPADTHGVILRGVSRVAIEDCLFDGIGGLAIVETMTAGGVVIRRNQIRNSRTTAMYFGCHSGSCTISGLVIEANYIENVTAPLHATGYGIQVKLNSTATIRDNIIFDTKGPGIMVYGSQRADVTSRIERNVTVGSRRSSGIVIGGGPALVRNNVAAGNAVGGITLEDYEGRHLLRGIEVSGNTVYGNRRGAIRVSGSLVDAVIMGNVFEAHRRTRETISDVRTA